MRPAPLLLALTTACGNVTVPAEESPAPEQPATATPQGIRAPPGVTYPRVSWVRGLADATSIVDMAVAPDGSIYVAADHGGGPPDGSPYPSSGPDDRMVLSRYWPDGRLEWRRELIGTDGPTFVAGVEVDTAGNAYLCGAFSEMIDFGLGSLTLDYGGVVAGKFAPDGTTLWARTIDSSPAWTFGCGLTSTGELVIGVSANVALPPQPIAVKLSSEGDVVWTLLNHTPAHSLFGLVAVAPGDELYLLYDAFGAAVDFGDGMPRYGDPTLLASLTVDGELRWSKGAGDVLPSDMHASEAGVLITSMSFEVPGEVSHLYSSSGDLAWQWEDLSSLESGRYDPRGAWVMGTKLLESTTQGFLARVDLDGVERSRLGLGLSTYATALASVDERHLLIAGAHTEDTSIAGETLTGTGNFLALVELAPP